jgi:RNA 2',3'-cyclic 3'-phosphodiesterase
VSGPAESLVSERARLFVAVWPPSGVLSALAAVRGADGPGVRWMGEEQWHVTLRFLGTVELAAALRALDEVRRVPGAIAVVQPSAVRLGREVLALSVDGLAHLAMAVDAAFTDLGRAPDHRPFRGHVTLARGKGVRSLGRVALPASMEWTVDSVSLVRSHQGRAGARYEDVAVVPLGPVVG